MEKDFIKDGMTNEELVNTIKEIIKRKNEMVFNDDNDKFEKLKNEFPKFAERYLMLFELVIRNEEFDWKSFDYMIGMRNKIINDEMTSEEASKKVGQVWFDKHVDVSRMNKRQRR
jgi:hypothetical protein